MKPTCLTQVRAFALFATSLIASGTVLAQAQTPNLDIVGIGEQSFHSFKSL